MTWTPDPEFAVHLSRIITRAFDEACELEEREGKVSDAKRAAQGTYLGGATLHGRRERAAAAFQSAGRRSITETVQALTEVYGTVSAEAVSWLRSDLSKRFETHARARADSLADDRLRHRLSVPRNDVNRAMTHTANSLLRDLEIALGPFEMRARLGSIARGDLPSCAPGVRDVDAFISHASADKADAARPLAAAIIDRGYTVRLDESEIVVGDSVFTKIDDGLRRSRFGVVILSPSFFARHWTQMELSALAALSAAEGSNRILPVWHNIDRDAVVAASPLLAAIRAVQMADGLTNVVDEIARALGPPRR